MVKQKPVRVPSKKNVEKVYPEYNTRKYAGDEELTVEQAKELLGWEQEEDGQDFKSDYLFTLNGKKVRTTKNNNNRPFDEPHARKLMQDMLQKRWRLNGQSIGIGEYGNVITGQHRLIALVLAEEERTGKQAGHWEDVWSGPVTIPVEITYGIDEGVETTRTIDNTKPRSMADCFYVDKGFFKKQDRKEREKLCRYLEFTVRNLWSRVKTKKERKKSFAPYLTHAEAMEFVRYHPRCEDTTLYVWEKDQAYADDEGKLLVNIKQTTDLTYGENAALMYLMGSSASDGDVYRNMEVPSEKEMVWDYWEKAESFYDDIAQATEEGITIKKAMAYMREENPDLNLTKDEKFACLINAWNKYKDGEEFEVSEIVPDWEDIKTSRELKDTATVGGIESLEDPEEPEETVESETGEYDLLAPTEEEPSESEQEEIAERAAAEKEAALEATKDKNAGKTREQLLRERHQARQTAQESGNGDEDSEEKKPAKRRPITRK